MSECLLDSVVVPIADEDDAATTARAIAPYVEAGDSLAVVHVVEKAGGAIDKASVEQREDHAGAIFEAFEGAFGDAMAGAPGGGEATFADETDNGTDGEIDDETDGEIDDETDGETSGAGDVAVDVEILYGTDVAETILAYAETWDATAIAYTSRGLSRWVEFLTGDVDDALVAAADRPVVVLPSPAD